MAPSIVRTTGALNNEFCITNYSLPITIIVGISLPNLTSFEGTTIVTVDNNWFKQYCSGIWIHMNRHMLHIFQPVSLN